MARRRRKKPDVPDLVRRDPGLTFINTGTPGREREVFRLVIEGKTTKETALALSLATRRT